MGSMMRFNILLLSMLVSFSSLASAMDYEDTAPHFVNIAGFYQLQDYKGELPEFIEGSEAVLLNKLNGKAHYLFLSGSSDVHNDDVINIQHDLLRKGKSGKFDNYGVNCSLTAFSLLNENHAHDGPVQMDEIKLTGSCSVLAITHKGEQIKDEGFVPPTFIPDGDDGEHQRWRLIFKDKSGVVIYASAESS